RFFRRWQRTGVAAEIRPERATADAHVAVLTGGPLRAVRQRRRQVGGPSDNQRATKLLGHRSLEFLLHTVELHRRQKLAVRKLRQILRAATDSDKALDMIVPGRQITIANGPVHRDAIARVRLEIHLAPAIALTPPRDGPSPNLITPYPIEPLLLDIGIIQLIDEPM